MKEVFIALVVFGLAGAGVWFGFRYRAEQREATDARPSIENFVAENLPENSAEEEVSDDAPDEIKNEDAPPMKPDAPETIAVKILNGGAAGGSAGKVATYLKQNGYAKAEAGNANGSNTGIVVYYAPEMADEVKALQLLLLKEYKGVTSKPVADAKISEAKTAPMVVVLGL